MNEYPKVQHKGGKIVTVHTHEEEEALGEGWISGHEFWSQKRAEAEKTIKRGKRDELAKS